MWAKIRSILGFSGTLAGNKQNISTSLVEQKQKGVQNVSITLANSGSVNDFPLRIFTIAGKMGYGKTTLANAIAKYYSDNGIEVVKVNSLSDLDRENSVLLIDDLKEDLTESVFNKIVENFRAARHRRQIIILTHQLIDRIPTALLELSEKVILFNSNFNPDQPTCRVNVLMPKADKHRLHETVLQLQPYQYVIIKEGRMYGPFSNTYIDPIVGDSCGKEIQLIKNNPNNGKNSNNFKNLLNNYKLVADIPEWDLLGTNQKIIMLARKYPHLKPKAIAAVVGTTPNTVRVTLSRYRKKGPKKE
jgi:hypothetical protein